MNDTTIIKVIGISIFIILILYAINFTTPPNKLIEIKFNGCMTGCFAGLNYNGTVFKKIDISEMTLNDVDSFEACETLCTIYSKNK